MRREGPQKCVEKILRVGREGRVGRPGRENNLTTRRGTWRTKVGKGRKSNDKYINHRKLKKLKALIRLE